MLKEKRGARQTEIACGPYSFPEALLLSWDGSNLDVNLVFLKGEEQFRHSLIFNMFTSNPSTDPLLPVLSKCSNVMPHLWTIVLKYASFYGAEDFECQT